MHVISVLELMIRRTNRSSPRRKPIECHLMYRGWRHPALLFLGIIPISGTEDLAREGNRFP